MHLRDEGRSFSWGGGEDVENEKVASPIQFSGRPMRPFSYSIFC